MMTRIAITVALLTLAAPVEAGTALQRCPVDDFAQLDLQALLEMASVEMAAPADYTHQSFEELDLAQLLSGASHDPLTEFAALDLGYLLNGGGLQGDFADLEMDELLGNKGPQRASH